MRPHRTHPINDSSQTGSLRRSVIELARTLGLNEETVGKAAIVATELGTNLVKHSTRGGEVLVRPLVHSDRTGIELISIDPGPGMGNPEKMQEDGVSTTGSPGTGLGAIKRLSDEFALYSAQGAGTVVLSRIMGVRHFERVWRAGFEWGVINLPKPGQELSGDGWGIILAKDHAQLMVVDGLGHGPGAAAAAHEAVRAFTEAVDLPPERAIEKVHARLRATRGAAVAIAEINPAEGLVVYAGIGNINGRILRQGEKTRNLVTMNGIVGHEMKRIQRFLYPWKRGSMLIMNSDGLLSSWDLSAFPGLVHHHPALAAALAYRENYRGTDDVAVVAIRCTGETEV
jgi:anti-sigma regulatory factor (Ser/Thr protein kinase)